jgi:pimeloyl-ACP methyl ester carboxylesterase
MGRLHGAAKAGAFLGAAAAGAAVAAAVPRYLAHRGRTTVADPYADERFDFPPTDSFITVTTRDGVHLHVETLGPVDAELTVVFAHGFLHDSAAFYFQRKALADAIGAGAPVRAVFYDQPGHGRSAAIPATEYSMEALAEALSDVIEQVAPTGDLMLVGHSMGGMTIQAYARLHPDRFRDRVRGVAFLSTSLGGLDAVESGPMRTLRQVRRTILPAMQQVATSTPQLVEGALRLRGDLSWLVVRRAAFAAERPAPSLVSLVERMNQDTPVQSVVGYVRAILDHDETAALPLFEGLPVIVVVGDGDELTPPDHARRLAEAIDGCELTVVTDAGHIPQLEYPSEISQRLLEMIDKITANRGVTT